MTPTQIRLAVAAAGLVAAFSAGWCGGWYTNGWRLSSGFNAERVAQRDAAAEVLRLALADRDRRAHELRTTNDTNLTKLQRAQHETNRLRDRVSSDAVRLRVGAFCPGVGVPAPAAAPGVADGAGAELDPTARRAYFALRDALDLSERKLTGCQAELTLRAR